MTIIVGSVCTGISADARAVLDAGLDWRHAYFAEIADFPSRVLASRYPEIPNLGDFTQIDASHRIDLLVGGTPCQDFSDAGLRRGLAGPSGILSLEFLRLAARARPTWIVWENVPGVLSQDGGRAFGAILGGLVELGYGFAYRVLDAQFFGLAQRRKRVFVVGCAGGQWQRAGAVLLERAGLRWDPPASPEARASATGDAEDGAGSGDVAGTLGTHQGRRPDAEGAAAGHLRVAGTLPAHGDAHATYQGAAQGLLIAGTARVAAPLTSRSYADSAADPRGRKNQGGAGVGELGDPSYTLNQHSSAVAILPFDTAQITHPDNRSNPHSGDPAPTLSSSLGKRAHAPAIAFHQTQDPIVGDELSPALGRKSMGMGMGMGSLVRRLTPRECERLMGFPDDYTAITWWMKSGRLAHAKDAPRYAALGNSIATTVLARIFRNIDRIHRMELP